MADITEDVKYLIEDYDPEHKIYSIVHFNQAIAKYAAGWKEEAEVMQRDGSVLKVMSRPRVYDDRPRETDIYTYPPVVAEEGQSPPADVDGPVVVITPQEPMPDGTPPKFFVKLVHRFRGSPRG